MLVNLQQSLSYIWGKEIPINDMNRVDAIHKLIENPQATEGEIDTLLARTQEVWNGFKTFLSKIKLTIWVLFWGKHSISLNEACENLKKIINKVKGAVEKILPKVEKKTLEIEKNEHAEQDSSNEEVFLHESVIHQNEVAVLKLRLEKFDEKNGNNYKLEYELRRYNETIQEKLEIIPLIEEFDRKSFELFAIQERLSKQRVVKGRIPQKLKSLNNVKKMKVEIQESALREMDERAKNLAVETENLRARINRNLWSINFRDDLKDLSIEVLQTKRKEYTELLLQRQRLESLLKQKEQVVFNSSR